MKSPLQILHLEDDPKDAELVHSILESEGIACATTRVETRDAFVAAIERNGIDLIISDFSLPAFDGLSAVEIAREKCPTVPFILVSGSLGEQLAIDSLQSGAADYVLKTHLARLAPAVRRAMDQAEERAGNRRTENELHEMEHRLQVIFSESPLGIALIKMDGHPVLTNAALQKMLGYTGEELNGLIFCELMHLEDRPKGVGLFEQLNQGVLTRYQADKRYTRKDGRLVCVHLSLSGAREARGPGEYAIGMIEDITERRLLEAQLIEAQKMEVIGQLAGGVAHDFNNILAVIMGYSDLAMQKQGIGEVLKGYLETIRSAAERAAGLTRQLLIFSRKQTVQLVVLDLNEVIQDLDKMLRRLIDENIEMTILPGPNIGRVKADSGYVGQVLMNLVVNARDAMPNGGKLTITTSNATLDKEYARTHTGAVPGDYVMFSVRDTGTGMTEEVKARLFEAFFTTKPKGKGTGLGLATCQTIVQQSSGHIGVCSEMGKGTTFEIYFPRVERPVDVAARAQTGPTPRGTETLLVVEDEPSVRHLARSVLEAQGYDVLSASNGQDALHTARDHQGEPIRLVITDVIMPLMGGKVMAEWLKTANPDLKILFTSGYTEEVVAEKGSAQKGIEFLPKPYTPGTLCRKVREMLDAK